VLVRQLVHPLATDAEDLGFLGPGDQVGQGGPSSLERAAACGLPTKPVTRVETRASAPGARVLDLTTRLLRSGDRAPLW
jgi:hypothetical protein